MNMMILMVLMTIYTGDGDAHAPRRLFALHRCLVTMMTMMVMVMMMVMMAICDAHGDGDGDVDSGGPSLRSWRPAPEYWTPTLGR